jgi:uncharacterized membrane protein
MTGSAPPPTRESSYSRDRIIAFSDGVFAIAITLLVLEIVPNIAHTVAGPQFVRDLLNMAPELVAYFLSFLVIGRFWDSHRVFFRFISVGDSRVSWINLLILLWITLIPATAARLLSTRSCSWRSCRIGCCGGMYPLRGMCEKRRYLRRPNSTSIGMLA